MRPNGLRRTAIGLTLTGIDHIDKVHIAVIVRIIVSPIDRILLIGQAASFNNSIGCVLVIAFVIIRIACIIICSVISHIATQGHRTKHIKLRTIRSVTLICKILTCRRIASINRTVQRVTQLIERSLRVTALHALVAEVRQDNHSLRCHVRFGTDILTLTASNTFRTACFRNCGRRSLAYFDIHAVDLTYLFTVTINRVVVKLITNHLHFDGCTICLRACLPSPTRRNSASSHHQTAQYCNNCNPLHVYSFLLNLLYSSFRKSVQSYCFFLIYANLQHKKMT